MIVALTGHRPSKLGGYDPDNPIATKVREAIRAKLVELKPEKIISGMALGVDQWAVQIAIDLGIPFIAAVPFPDQAGRWRPSSKREYLRLLGLASEVVVVSTTHSPVAMQTRNEWMVDHADVVLAVWGGTRGGTANCVRYANLMKTPVVRINPSALL
jgi:uncharacterized phage-like protein YoqJ